MLHPLHYRRLEEIRTRHLAIGTDKKIIRRYLEAFVPNLKPPPPPILTSKDMQDYFIFAQL